MKLANQHCRTLTPTNGRFALLSSSVFFDSTLKLLDLTTRPAIPAASITLVQGRQRRLEAVHQVVVLSFLRRMMRPELRYVVPAAPVSVKSKSCFPRREHDTVRTPAL
jgi:hypothetical protein